MSEPTWGLPWYGLRPILTSDALCEALLNILPKSRSLATDKQLQGQAGSDVAKDASDIILTDDNFASILNAVEEGRRLFDNIKRFVLHVLAENIAQATTLLVGLAFKDANGNSVFPLAPVQILWVIMVRGSPASHPKGSRAPADPII